MNVVVKRDPMVDAAYIWLSDEPYAYGTRLDEERRVDYAEDGNPVGVELLGVSGGVNIEGLPGGERVARILEEHNIKVVEPA